MEKNTGFWMKVFLGADIMFPLEGYFGPETYVITSKKTSIEDVTKMMLDQMDRNLSNKDKISNFYD